jgi:indole-3-glycerol phosphate synthase
MANILEKIRLEREKQLLQEKQLLSKPSLIKALKKDGIQIIGEIKRASPSKGKIAEDTFDIDKQLDYYVKNNIAAFSILTENHFFKGRNEDLTHAGRLYPEIPILRKDFIFDPFQVAQAKFIGAGAVLLIVKMLSDSRLAELHKLALELELEVLVEIHNTEDMERALKIPDIALMGINNRNLDTFETSLSVTEELFPKIPSDRNITIISESGIHTGDDLKFVESIGVEGVLIGESLMKGSLLNAVR